MDTTPETVTVVITRADGGMTVKKIIRTEFNEPQEGDEFPFPSLHRDITPEFIEAELAKRPHMFANHQGWEIVPDDYVDDTTDRTFRNAWVHTKGKGKPDHDMSKAREIHRVYLRKARLAEFCRLDNDYRIADEAGDVPEKRRIGAERQAFRDVTDDPRIEAAQNVDELKALRLETLLPEITKGVSYMNQKMRVSPFIPSNQPEQATATPTQQGEENGTERR